MCVCVCVCVRVCVRACVCARARVCACDSEPSVVSPPHRSGAAEYILLLIGSQPTVPHKDFSDLYEKMSGKGEVLVRRTSA